LVKIDLQIERRFRKSPNKTRTHERVALLEILVFLFCEIR
jgi:hypothetical protein